MAPLVRLAVTAALSSTGEKIPCPTVLLRRERPSSAAFASHRPLGLTASSPSALAARSSATDAATVSSSTAPPVAPTEVERKTALHRLFASDTEGSLRQFDICPSLFRSLPPHPDSLPPRLELPPPVPHPNPNRRLRPTYALIVSYDGSKFPGGYEHNPRITARTVRGTLTDRVTRAGGGHRISTAGRTDAGVSAKSALFTFGSGKEVPESFEDDLNAMGEGGDMRVLAVRRVHSSFHATFSAVSREYLYVLPLPPVESTAAMARLARVVDAMLSEVVGVEMDYFGMSSHKVKTQTSLCTVLDAGCWCYDGMGRPMGRADDVVPEFGDCWREEVFQQKQSSTSVDGGEAPYSAGDGCLVFRIQGNRFLRRMVRKIVNSLLQEATRILEEEEDGCIDLEDSEKWSRRWRERVELRDRSGSTPAPPGGLCLWRVEVDSSM